jgi:hypothetical protein
MPVVITPSGLAPTQYISPVDGEFVDGASILGVAQPIVNQVDRLTKKTVGARQYFEMLVGTPSPVRNYLFLFDTAKGWVQSSVAGAGDIWFPLGPLPRNQSDAPLYLIQADIKIRPVSRASLPATMPRFSLKYVGPSGIGDLTGDVYTDTSPDASTYITTHDIVGLLSTSWALDWEPSPAIFLKFEGETGANSVIDMKVLGIKLTLSETPL